MKRLLTIMLTMSALAIFLVGCGKSDGVGQEQEKNQGKKQGTEEQQEIIIGIDDKFAPMGFRDEDNEIVGFDIDYAKAAVEHMGLTAKFQPIDWKTKETELSSGRIDLIWNGYTINKERKAKVLFTKPYLKNAQVVATLADSPLTELADLEGQNIGVQALSSAIDALNANPIHTKIKTLSEYGDNVLTLMDLKTGRVDAVVIDEVVIDYYMSKEEGTFKVLEEGLAPEEYGVGVKMGNEELLEKLQKALDEMSEDGTAAEISQKWFGEDKVLK